MMKRTRYVCRNRFAPKRVYCIMKHTPYTLAAEVAEKPKETVVGNNSRTIDSLVH
ncbi:MAG: hypothetical protein H7Y38_18135 [Armatimonadetes bacterium]|nr:hypothetical protein [Armatimonadota bacterium]